MMVIRIKHDGDNERILQSWLAQLGQGVFLDLSQATALPAISMCTENKTSQVCGLLTSLDLVTCYSRGELFDGAEQC